MHREKQTKIRIRGTVSQPITKGRVPLLRLCEIDARHSLCYGVNAVLSRTVISVIVAMTVPLGATPLSARSCILSNVASEKACKPGCCANKICCATSPRNTAPPSQPLAKADSGQQPSAICFAAALPLSSREVGAEQFRFQAAAPLANSPPRLALLCTFLI